MQNLPTRDDIRNTASTLAHLWASKGGRGGTKDHEGVRRIIASHPPALRLPLCALVLERLNMNYQSLAAEAFDDLLFDMADIEEAI